MKHKEWVCALAVGLALTFGLHHTPAAQAGPLEDGMAAHARGDFVAAQRLLEPLAQAGDPAAQRALGEMYRYGQGVHKDPSYAYLWLSLAVAGMRAGPQRELTVEERDRVAATLSRRELSDLQDRALAWSPQ